MENLSDSYFTEIFIEQATSMKNEIEFKIWEINLKALKYVYIFTLEFLHLHTRKIE